MRAKGFLPTRWHLALGFLGAMGTTTKLLAKPADHAVHHVDTLSTHNYKLPTGTAIAEGPHSTDENDASDEPTSPEWTKAQCYKAWKHNMKLCNASPPNMRPACWAAGSALLAACLKAAK